MTDAPSLSEQVNEVEIHALGLRSMVERAEAGQIRRNPDEIDVMRKRMLVADAAARTLYLVAEKVAAREKANASREAAEAV